MPPKTRSRGVPPPSRVYHSTPTAQQAQFPPRRRTVRTYGKQKQGTGESARSLRQQTLTQIDFVSSFEEERDPIVLSSDSDEVEDEDKENQPEKKKDVKKEEQPEDEGVVEDEEDEDEDEAPVSSGRKRRGKSRSVAKTKRRRTLGDDKESNKSKNDRRKTMGDAPTSNYHTQTLTQFLGHDAYTTCIKDSDDEDEEDDDGFQNWLGEGESGGTPPPKRPAGSPSKNKKRSPLKVLYNEGTPSREESMVPQTPAKPQREEIPSSNQTTPLTGMLDLHGHSPRNPSPLKQRSDSLASTVVPAEDGDGDESPISDAVMERMIGRYGPPNADPSPSQKKAISSTASTTATAAAPLNLKTFTPKLTIEDSFATESWGSADATTPTPRRITKAIIVTPKRAQTPTRESSSLADEEEGDVDTPTRPRQQRRESTELGDQEKTPKMKRVSPAKAKKVLLEIPDSDEEDDGFDDDDDDDGFVAGPETQFVLNELASSTASTTKHTLPSTSLIAPTNNSSHPTTPSSSPKPRLRTPIHHPSPLSTHTQPFESQRVPATTLRALPPQSDRSDILLPLPASTIDAVVGGYEVHLKLPFRVPPQVVRVWLFDEGEECLRFMACLVQQDGEDGMRLGQVYELNNPLEGSDIVEEGWWERSKRYTYIPPAIVGQLLWNLRHALFREVDEPLSSQQQPQPLSSQPPPPPSTTPPSISQQLEAQLRSDIAALPPSSSSSSAILVPSTPSPPRRPKRASHLSHPPTSYRAISQPTQASQASPSPESSSLTFQEGSSSPPPMFVGSGTAAAVAESQLLTRSQMLSDSLVRDDARVPGQIWDSDEEGDDAL